MTTRAPAVLINPHQNNLITLGPSIMGVSASAGRWHSVHLRQAWKGCEVIRMMEGSVMMNLGFGILGSGAPCGRICRPAELSPRGKLSCHRQGTFWSSWRTMVNNLSQQTHSTAWGPPWTCKSPSTFSAEWHLRQNPPSPPHSVSKVEKTVFSWGISYFLG